MLCTLPMKSTLIAFSAAALVHARTLTVRNECSYTIWFVSSL